MGSRGIEDIKGHPFFAQLRWDSLHRGTHASYLKELELNSISNSSWAFQTFHTSSYRVREPEHEPDTLERVRFFSSLFLTWAVHSTRRQGRQSAVQREMGWVHVSCSARCFRRSIGRHHPCPTQNIHWGQYSCTCVSLYSCQILSLAIWHRQYYQTKAKRRRSQGDCHVRNTQDGEEGRGCYCEEETASADQDERARCSGCATEKAAERCRRAGSEIQGAIGKSYSFTDDIVDESLSLFTN